MDKVMTDNGLVTSRKLDNIPAFNREMIAFFGETGAASKEFERRIAKVLCNHPTGCRLDVVSGRTGV